MSWKKNTCCVWVSGVAEMMVCLHLPRCKQREIISPFSVTRATFVAQRAAPNNNREKKQRAKEKSTNSGPLKLHRAVFHSQTHPKASSSDLCLS